MSRLDDWRNTSRLSQPTAAERASSVWFWINRKAHSLVFTRGATTLTAQTVRIEWDNVQGQESTSASGRGSKNLLRIFGIQGHSTYADTDIQRGDRFSLNSTNSRLNYEVISVDKTQIGQIQATAEEMQ
jgi:hypothetical protein